MKPALALREDPMNEAFAEADDGTAGPESPEAAAERRLLEELKRGAGRRRRVVEATYARVYGSLVRMCGDPDQAADLTQETYRKAWQSLAGFRESSQVSTWLYRIAYNTFLNSRRRPFRIVPLEPAVEATAVGDDPPPDETAEKHESRDRLRRAVLALPGLRSVVPPTTGAGHRGDRQARGMTPPGVRKVSPAPSRHSSRTGQVMNPNDNDLKMLDRELRDFLSPAPAACREDPPRSPTPPLSPARPRRPNPAAPWLCGSRLSSSRRRRHRRLAS
jgi:RNA polymerase sigma factor (sigma-70 family)